MKREGANRQEKEKVVAAAKDYVNKQLAIMREHGSAPDLTPEAYEALVQKVVAASR